MGTENCQGNLTKCWEVTCDGLASHPGGEAILLFASCYGNRDKLRSYARQARNLTFWLTGTIQINSCPVIKRFCKFFEKKVCLKLIKRGKPLYHILLKYKMLQIQHRSHYLELF